jgi:phosphoribosyl 1,2-cyclic phosphate phosphodiesterase
MIKHKIYNLDAVLLTHEHYDHVGGLDDLRPFCKEGAVDVYAEDNVLEAIRTRMPYAFRVPHFKGVPDMELHSVKIEPFEAAGIRIVPVRIWHSPHLPILGYRIGNMAYLTDVKYIPEEEMHKLEGLDLLVIDALRKKPHPTHQTVDEAIKHVRRLKPRLTYFIHMSHHLGLHAEVENELPQDIHLAYDGACIEI